MNYKLYRVSLHHKEYQVQRRGELSFPKNLASGAEISAFLRFEMMQVRSDCGVNVGSESGVAHSGVPNAR